MTSKNASFYSSTHVMYPSNTPQIRHIISLYLHMLTIDINARFDCQQSKNSDVCTRKAKDPKTLRKNDPFISADSIHPNKEIIFYYYLL
ncbi:hypothetical protein RclHR1_00200009 [Rhizophagus clarus]|uniref:Uncharacterized protein n=1 Tax=Rhizophagus clarus TaxID=94130 RepID=A0A2Z6RJ24_9GLOM|nr:hypothetical protein RclHR1_00200009 [Rhizophagus clarus]GES99497.1 hypothetical protein RCL_e7312_RclHR1_00200009 [Rhizophagus clarus]